MADMEILGDLGESFGHLMGVSDVIDPVEMVGELKRLLTREIDYTVEARSIQRFEKNFAGDPNVFVPKVYWSLTTRRVLTMDFVKGIEVDELEEIKRAGLDPEKIANILGQAVARMIFVHGYFHGDPHGGNILVQDKGNIALLDFGSVGYIDSRMKDNVRLFCLSIAREDVARATGIFLDICGVPEDRVNLPAVEQDFREFRDYMGLRRAGHDIEDGIHSPKTRLRTPCPVHTA